MKQRILLLFLLALPCLLSEANAQNNNARMLSGVNAQTQTSYQFAPTDATVLTTFANAGAVAVTLPAAGTIGFQAGTEFDAQNLGPGNVVITSPSLIFSNGAGTTTLTLTAGQGVQLFSSGLSYSALLPGSGGGGGGGGGSGTVDAALQYEFPFYNQPGTTDRVGGLAVSSGYDGVPQIPSETTSGGGTLAQPLVSPMGVPHDVSTCPGNIDTIPLTSRAHYRTWNDNSACVVTLPQAGTSGFGANFTMVGCNIGTGTVTISPVISTISYSNGASYTSGASSMPLGTGQCFFIYSDNLNYFAIQLSNTSPIGVSKGSALVSSGVNQPPAYQSKVVIDVRDYGVTCDGVTDDTTAGNAALAAAVAVGTTSGSAHVKFPAGICLGNFSIVQGKGLKIEGSGQLSTHLRSPNANPALQINGLWYSSFSDLTFDTKTHTTGNAVVEIDGDWDGVHTQKVQFVTFQNVLFAGQGTSDGQLSDYAVYVCRQSVGVCQGSNLTFINDAWSGASIAAYYQYGFNALGNQIIGGDFQNYTKDGIHNYSGTMQIIGTTFETNNGCAQLINGGVDIYTSGGSFPTNVISGVRSEGWNLVAATASLYAIAQNPAFITYLSNHAFALNTPIAQTGADGLSHLYCATQAGTTGVSPPTWPTAGTVTDGTVVWTEENYNALSLSALSWFNSADSHLDPTATVSWPRWTSLAGNSTVDSSGLLNGGPFDASIANTGGYVEHIVQQQNGTGVEIYASPQGTSKASSAKFISNLPPVSAGILTRGGVIKLYLGDNLYEGAEGSSALAQYHFTTTLNGEGTFAQSSGSVNFSSLFLQPIINQTGTASGSATILGAYPVLTSTRGTPLLMGLGTAASFGGVQTNKFTVDPSGNVSATGQIASTVATGTPPLSVASTTPVANLTTVPITYNIGGAQQTGVHIVRDHCTLGTNCSVTLTGPAVFTSSTSYECSAVDETSAAAVKFAPSSGSAFAMTGTGTDVISFVCVGN